jgi:hypothetical protein
MNYKKVSQKLVNITYIVKCINNTMDWTGKLKKERINARYRLSKLL